MSVPHYVAVTGELYYSYSESVRNSPSFLTGKALQTGNSIPIEQRARKAIQLKALLRMLRTNLERPLRKGLLPIAAFVFAANGCANPRPETDFVRIVPIKLFAPGSRPDASNQFEWLPVSASETGNFRVEVGSKQYFAIYDRVGGDNVALIKSELARIAEKEVIAGRFCTTGIAHTVTPQLVGPRNGEYMWVVVACGSG